MPYAAEPRGRPAGRRLIRDAPAASGPAGR